MQRDFQSKKYICERKRRPSPVYTGELPQRRRTRENARRNESGDERAQRARGADFESGNLIQRAKALIPLLVPLFISAFRRADELAVAMECRCYHGGEGRTRMRKLQFAPRDFIALVIGALMLAAVIVLKVLGI